MASAAGLDAFDEQAKLVEAREQALWNKVHFFIENSNLTKIYYFQISKRNCFIFYVNLPIFQNQAEERNLALRASGAVSPPMPKQLPYPPTADPG